MSDPSAMEPAEGSRETADAQGADDAAQTPADRGDADRSDREGSGPADPDESGDA